MPEKNMARHRAQMPDGTQQILNLDETTVTDGIIVRIPNTGRRPRPGTVSWSTPTPN